MAISQTAIDDLFTAAPTPSAPQPASTPHSPEVSRILGLTVCLSVVVAERMLNVETIVAIAVGTILEFDQASDADLRLTIGNHVIGTGRAVKVGENFGVRITAIESVEKRIGAMRSG